LDCYLARSRRKPSRAQLEETVNRIEDRFSRQVLRCLQRGPSLRGRETRPCLGILEENFDFVQPEPARAEDLLLVHSQAHVSHVEHDTHLFEVGSLAVGGAIRASEISLTGEPAFGLMRPPGHYASPNSCLGFCYFNNIAIATRRLIHAEEIERALIVDFDLHFGDGTANTFAGDASVVYYHMGPTPRDLDSFLSNAGSFDALAVSAGFDRASQTGAEH